MNDITLQVKSDIGMNVTDIFRKYQAQLKGYISKQIPDKDDTEDILQNVFYQLLKMYDKESPVEQISGWLYSVTRNQIIDNHRKHREDSLPYYLSDDDEYKTLDIYDEKTSPENDYLRSLIWKELEIALSELPAEQRTVFELTELQGISFKEIAETTGIPTNTLISRKRYAVLHLRERMRELYDDLINSQ